MQGLPDASLVLDPWMTILKHASGCSLAARGIMFFPGGERSGAWCELGFELETRPQSSVMGQSIGLIELASDSMDPQQDDEPKGSSAGQEEGVVWRSWVPRSFRVEPEPLLTFRKAPKPRAAGLCYASVVYALLHGSKTASSSHGGEGSRFGSQGPKPKVPRFYTHA
jgi:hypothetical protein